MLPKQMSSPAKTKALGKSFQLKAINISQQHGARTECNKVSFLFATLVRGFIENATDGAELPYNCIDETFECTVS